MTLPVRRREAIGIVAGAAAGFAAGPSFANPADDGMTPTGLRCEWRDAPIGIDTTLPRFTWEATAGGKRDKRMTAARVLVASTPALLTARTGDIWDSGSLTGTRMRAQPAQPLTLRSHHHYHWIVAMTDETGATRWSAAARFTTGILDPAEWHAAWIAAGPEFPPRPPHARGQDKGPPVDPQQTILPLLRRTITLDCAPIEAIVSMAGLGHGALTVNGRPATDALLEPGWTDYRRTILYATYDIAPLLVPGENVLEVALGNGMFNVERKAERKSKFVDSFGRPKLLLQATLRFPDGSRRTLASDRDWHAAEGSILFSSIFGGEDVDARRSIRDWRPVHIVEGPGGTLKAQGTEPVRVQARFDTVRITEPRSGIFVYDLGTNFAGRPALTVRGPAGRSVRLIPCETLGEDGLAWQRSFNAGPGRMVEYNYTLAGTGDELFVPQFTYHGFRYLQVEGAAPADRAGDGLPQIVALRGEFLHADLAQTGAFSCSKPLFNDIHRLIERSVLSNAVSILTDCPHREKLGWLEQTHLNASTVAYNRDAAALYEKITADIADAQREDGMVPGIAPEYVAFLKPDGSDDAPRSSPEWGAAAILSPWTAYRFYGDPECLADGYPTMRRYAAFLDRMAKGDIVDFGLGDWYDVGPGKLGASQLTSRALTGTATWYEALVALTAISRLLHRPEGEITAYAAKAEAVRAAFNARFFDSARGSYDRDSQTANAMPLALGMVPPGREVDALAALVRAVRASGNAVTAGDVGFHYVVRALTEHGCDDVLFDMMSVTDRPSYGYQLAKGATALAESWSADPTKSLNHFMLGHGEGWLFGSLAGIRIDFAASAERVLTIAPRPVGDVMHAEAKLRSVLGPIRSAWRRHGAMLEVEIDIPAGAIATIVLPTVLPAKARESSVPLAQASGIRNVESTRRGLEALVGSGQYHFAVPFGVA